MHEQYLVRWFWKVGAK